MKLTLRRIILTILAAVIFLSFAMIVSLSSYGATVKAPLHNGSKNHDSIFIQKKAISKFHKIGLYPDATQKVVFFTVRGEQGKVYQLYVFDLEGNLIRQREIRNKQTTFIKDIEKGVYLFDVFCDDDKIGNGQIAVR
jgi:hypothetical protein